MGPYSASVGGCNSFLLLRNFLFLFLLGYSTACTFAPKSSTNSSTHFDFVTTSPETKFPTFVEFIAMFLGCGHENFLLTTSPVKNLELDMVFPPNHFHSNSCHSRLSLLYTTDGNNNRHKIFNQYYSNILSLCPSSKNKCSWLSIILILSGDLERNPGPRTVKCPCGICKKACANRQPAVA